MISKSCHERFTANDNQTHKALNHPVVYGEWPVNIHIKIRRGRSKTQRYHEMQVPEV